MGTGTRVEAAEGTGTGTVLTGFTVDTGDGRGFLVGVAVALPMMGVCMGVGVAVLFERMGVLRGVAVGQGFERQGVDMGVGVLVSPPGGLLGPPMKVTPAHSIVARTRPIAMPVTMPVPSAPLLLVFLIGSLFILFVLPLIGYCRLRV
jgi:hypothetical protein